MGVPLDGTDEKVLPSGSADYEVQNGSSEGLEGGFLATTRRWIRAIGAEEAGTERIPEDMRTNQHPRDLAAIFFAANCNTATLALGYLGTTTFGLGWWDSFLAIVFFNVFGSIFPALVAMFGPKLGMRTMIIPRYSFGWWPAKILAFLNVINQIGWGIVNNISGAAVLYDAGDGNLPLAVAVLLLALVAVAFGLLGYRILHIYTRYSWMVMLVCFIIVAGFGGRHFINLPMGSGSVEAANVLSFGTSIIGFQVAWLVIAADYGVYMREDLSQRKIFSWAFAGLVSSQVLIELLGAAVGSLSLSTEPLIADAFAARGLGGLIGSVFEGMGPGVRGFGKFIEVVIGFSTAGVITTNVYSLALNVQMISPSLMAIPRFFWTLIGSAVLLACAIAGRDHLEKVMENFLLMCAYWIVPFSTILLAEHYIWRRHYEYDVTAWNDPKRLPFGIAASVAWVVNTVISVLSMSQAWWVGPIAAGVGGSEFGTDISWELALAGSLIIYIPLRIIERRVWKF